MTADPLKCFRLTKDLNDQYREKILNYPARFRASLNSISLISLRPDSPQTGIKFPCSELAKVSATNIQQYLGKLNRVGMPGRPTPEKELQSWIIRHTMNNAAMPFDKNISFVTDEFARTTAGTKLVADIFGFNRKVNTLAIIELKSNRSLTELTRQLDKCEELIQADTSFYKALLQTQGFEWEEPYRIQKIAVWPCTKTGQPKRFKPGIREICYCKVNDSFLFREMME